MRGQIDTLERVHATLLGEALAEAPVAAFLTDDDGNLIAANRRACDLSGATRAELLAQPLDGDVHAEILGGRREGDGVLRRADGTELDVRYVAYETSVTGLPFVLALVRER